jgi:hypothetical protein
MATPGELQGLSLIRAMHGAAAAVFHIGLMK